MRAMLFLLLTTIVVLVSGCKNAEPTNMLSTAGGKAESVYLTHDENNNPVVVWTETQSGKLTLFFSVSHDNGKSFSDKRSLALTSDVATHAEGMPKVAFKRDGTIIAAYEKKAPTEQNKYAGAIYYVMSNDNGQTWTKEAFLHSDTVAGRSRSYFDIERLADGEIGASWLDIKLDKKSGGRSIRFAKTTDTQGFGNEILVDSSACQCCRLDVYTDMAGQVNIAYRGLKAGPMGQQIRDMMIATSRTNGRAFKAPMRISQDNWNIDGCPHTGPSLCSTKSGLYSMWYTEGNGTGIFYSFKQNESEQFADKRQVSNSGRHPQLSASETQFILVWEENSDREDHATTIMCEVSDGISSKRKPLNPESSNAYLPVVTQTNNGFLVAYLMDTKEGVGLFTARLH